MRIGEVAANRHGEVVSAPQEKQPARHASRRDGTDLTADSGQPRRELEYRRVVPFQEALPRPVARGRASSAAQVAAAGFALAAEDAILADRAGGR